MASLTAAGGGTSQSAAPVLARRQPDPRRQPERLGDRRAEEGAGGRAARRPADHLADQPAVGAHVVAVPGPGFPRRRLRGQGPHDRLPRQHLGEGEVALDVGQADPVAEQPAHGDVALAGRRELRPVTGHRCVDVELAPLHQQVGGDGRETLGAAEDPDDRVVGPRAVRGGVGLAAPQIDDRTAVAVHGHRGADVAAPLEIGDEGVANRLEARGHRPVDRHAHGREP